MLVLEVNCEYRMKENILNTMSYIDNVKKIFDVAEIIENFHFSTFKANFKRISNIMRPFMWTI